MYAFAQERLDYFYQRVTVVDGVSRTEPTFRRIPLSRRSHITGFQPLAAGIVEHESALERDFVTLSSFLDADAAIAAQPITLTFRHEGRSRRYTPDYLVRWSSRRTELVEVKYQADLDANEERLRPAFATARAWADRAGASFRVAAKATRRAGRSAVRRPGKVPGMLRPVRKLDSPRIPQKHAA
jgi:TnsA endonuclease N terminal